MLATESTQNRRIIGRLERGEELTEAFATLARDYNIRTAWLTGLGAFEWVELVEYNQEKRSYEAPRLFNAPCELLSLNGNISYKDGAPAVHLHATISRETDNGIEVLGGHVNAAVAFACEFFVECCDDAALQRKYDQATGLSLWSPGLGSVSVSHNSVPAAAASHSGHPVNETRAARSPSTSPSANPAMRAARTSSSVTGSSAPNLRAPSAQPGTRSPSYAGRRIPSVNATLSPMPTPPPAVNDQPLPGDAVEHPQYGLCEVQSLASDGALVVRLMSGAHKTIHLDYLIVHAPYMQGGQRIFPLRSRRKER